MMKNYFSHKTSELGTSDCKCQADMLSWPDVVLLLAFLMYNFAFATTKLHGNNKNNNKNNNNNKNYSVIYHLTENACWFIFLVFFLCFMYHFVVVATTQLHSNYNNNKTKVNVYKLLNFE